MKEIGQKLKEARIEKGYTLDDLQQITKIQKRYLIAIEDGNFDVMPGAFYVRAFIKQYADIVGLDGDELLTTYNGEVPEVQPEQELAEKISTATQTRSVSNMKNEFFDRLRNMLPMILIGVIAIVILLGIYFITIQSGKQSNKAIETDSSSVKSVSKDVSDKDVEGSEPKVNDQTEKEKQAVEKKKAEKKAKATKTGNIKMLTNTATGGTYVLEEAPKENVLSIKADNGDSWINVSKADNTTLVEKTYKSGESAEVKIPADVKEVKITIGNSKAAKLKLNGKEFKYMPDDQSTTLRNVQLQFTEGKAEDISTNQ